MHHRSNLISRCLWWNLIKGTVEIVPQALSSLITHFTMKKYVYDNRVQKSLIHLLTMMTRHYRRTGTPTLLINRPLWNMAGTSVLSNDGRTPDAGNKDSITYKMKIFVKVPDACLYRHFAGVYPGFCAAFTQLQNTLKEINNVLGMFDPLQKLTFVSAI